MYVFFQRSCSAFSLAVFCCKHWLLSGIFYSGLLRFYPNVSYNVVVVSTSDTLGVGFQSRVNCSISASLGAASIYCIHVITFAFAVILQYYWLRLSFNHGFPQPDSEEGAWR
ncbi:hypothetical protein V6N13_110490 [Hibiscus sabdariffa]|uniref:Uncharacterized protein n=1 Tax=Hibiscus sabdariffa TaxID=183260 RepID=A0ABR2THE1_9ROSI